MARNTTSRQGGRLIKKMRIDNNSVIAVKSGTSVATSQALDGIAEAVAKKGLKKVIIVVVDDLDDLTILSEEEMNKQGWYSVQALRMMVAKSNQEKMLANMPSKNDEGEDEIEEE